MGKKYKRKLIEWFPEAPPAPTRWNYWAPKPYHVQIEAILADPRRRRKSIDIAEVLENLVKDAVRLLRREETASGLSKASVVKSLCYVRDNFYLLEELVNSGTIMVSDILQFYTWSVTLEQLEPLGFEFPNVKRQLMMWKLRNESKIESLTTV
jgi:hypothetical protein